MATPPRPWFSFRLRTLFVLVAITSVPLAWVGYSLNWSARRHRLLEELAASYGNRVLMATDALVAPLSMPRGLAIIGEPAVAAIRMPKDVSPALAERITAEFPEAWIIPADFRPAP